MRVVVARRLVYGGAIAFSAGFFWTLMSGLYNPDYDGFSMFIAAAGGFAMMAGGVLAVWEPPRRDQ